MTDDRISRLWPTNFFLPATRRKTLLAFARAIESEARAEMEAKICALRADAKRYDYLRRINGWGKTDDVEIDAAIGREA